MPISRRWVGIETVAATCRAYDANERSLQFKQMKSLQKSASVHASIHNQFSQERHFVDRISYKDSRSVASTDGQSLANRILSAAASVRPVDSGSH